MKGRKIITFSLLATCLLVFPGCKKNKNGDGPSEPAATTGSATMIGRGWATLNGTVHPGNLTTTVTFEYGTTNSYGANLDAVPGSISDNKVTSVLANITGLLPGTEYHFRVKAVSQAGTKYGNGLTFTTTTPKGFTINFNQGTTYGSITDNEGNTYKTVVIGAQTWMAENLRSLKLNDGSAISFLPDHPSWVSAEVPGYCWFNSDSVGYGALYNWYSVNTGKLCPAGWRVPTDEEWTQLTTHLGGASTAGNKLKESGLLHWLAPNAAATNESGFTALPGGYRGPTGAFRDMGSLGYWWTSTASMTTNAWYRALSYNYSDVDRTSSSRKSGLSVRCIKN